MDKEELVEILEEIARQNVNLSARVSAIRLLRQIREDEEGDTKPLAEVSNLEAFRKLDEEIEARKGTL